jgi:hypothetical protein
LVLLPSRKFETEYQFEGYLSGILILVQRCS